MVMVERASFNGGEVGGEEETGKREIENGGIIRN